jgi:hypothetical protein
VSEITMGLKRDACVRLRATWAAVPEAARAKLAALTAVVEDKQNYKAYKAELKALPADTPVVPHLGAHTSELTMQEQMLPGDVEAYRGGPKVTHFKRYRVLWGLIADVLALQGRDYGAALGGAPALPAVINALNAAVRPFVFCFDEDREAAVDHLLARSRAVEPD